MEKMDGITAEGVERVMLSSLNLYIGGRFIGERESLEIAKGFSRLMKRVLGPSFGEEHIMMQLKLGFFKEQLEKVFDDECERDHS